MLPFTPPSREDASFYRGQFCGIRIPGAPWVPGCNAANTDLMMTCLLDRYPVEWQDAFLLKYAQDGYMDLQRSWGHAMASPDEGWPGVSLEQFNALSRTAQRVYGLRIDQWIIGGGALYNCNQPLEYWQPIIDELVDSFLAAGVMDKACVGWQLDQLFGATPGNDCMRVLAYCADRIPTGIPVFTHWMNEALAWWKTGGEVWTDRYGSINVHDRFSWWLAMRPYLTGGHHQGDTTIARTQPKLYQDKLRDTLNAFHDGRMGLSRRTGVEVPFQLTVFECSAQDQFDGKTSEDTGDQVGYILMCTQSDGTNQPMNGYGNGGRMPDGVVL